MKSQKGLTLTSVAIYIVILFIVIGILATISANFQGGIKQSNSEGTEIAEINRFNMYFLEEVKKQGNNVDSINSRLIKFSTGKIFLYDDVKKCIEVFENDTKVIIAKNIENCTFESREENGKTIITVTIKAKSSEIKELEYVLNYDKMGYINEEDYISTTPIIPKQYEMIQYIECTGTQYIDTGYVFKDKPKVVGKIMVSSTVDSDIMGTASATNGCFIINFDSNRIFYRYSSSSATRMNHGIDTYKWYDFEFSDSVIIDGTTKATVETYDFSSNNQSFLIGKGRSYGKCKFQEIKMYDGEGNQEILVRDLIPCYRKNDGEVGMYDIITKTFYANESGNGSFEMPNALNSVLPSQYQEVKYIQATGAEYIDTGYIFKEKPKINTEIMLIKTIDADIMGTATNAVGCYIIDFNAGTLYYRYSSSSSTSITTGISVETWNTFEFSDNVIVNEVQKGSIATYDFSSNNQTFYIGRGRNFGYARFKRIQMYDDTTLVRDLVPCYRKSDGEVGMFDIQNNVFYTNLGSGEFTI